MLLIYLILISLSNPLEGEMWKITVSHSKRRTSSERRFSNKIFHSEKVHFSLGDKHNCRGLRFHASYNTWCPIWSGGAIGPYLRQHLGCYGQLGALRSHDNQLFSALQLQKTTWNICCFNKKLPEEAATCRNALANMTLLLFYTRKVLFIDCCGLFQL